jgi:hypothetical protein
LRGIKVSEHENWPLWPSWNKDKTQSGHRKLKTPLDSADKFTVTPIDHRFFGITAFEITSFGTLGWKHNGSDRNDLETGTLENETRFVRIALTKKKTNIHLQRRIRKNGPEALFLKCLQTEVAMETEK